MAHNAEDLAQRLAQNLKGTDVEALLAALAGMKNANPAAPTEEEKKEEKPEASRQQDKPQVTPSPDQNEKTVLSNLKPSVKPEQPASGILALYSRNYIQRIIPNTREPNSFTPTFNKMFWILNEMDFLMSQNYYARRSIPCLFPTVSRLYISIIAVVQTLRCQYYMRDIPDTQSDFLERFLEMFPPESLPVPAPLLTIFQSICCSEPEDSKYTKVFPKIYDAYHNPALSIMQNISSDNVVHYMVPYVPALIWFYNELISRNVTGLTLGNDDSHARGYKTLTPTYDGSLAMDRRPKDAFFPFAVHHNASHVPNATAAAPNVTNTLRFGAVTATDFNTLDAANKRQTTKTGLAYPLKYPKSLSDQFKDSFDMIDVPHMNRIDGTTFTNLMGFKDGFSWFAELVNTMSTYSRFFPDSGTIADCSILGPASNQYIARVATQNPLPADPASFGQIIPHFSVKLTTTRAGEEVITESMAYHSQIHTRMYSTHPWLSNLGAGNTHRHGPFWDNKPVFQNSTTDEGWVRIPTYLKSTIQERLK
nr:capsid protein [Sarcosphaera coronaria partitivirus]